MNMAMQRWQLQLGLALLLVAAVHGFKTLEAEDSASEALHSDSAPIETNPGRRSLQAYAGRQPAPLRLIGGKPCVPSTITVRIFKEGDFSERLRYPKNQIVKLVLQTSILFKNGYTFDARYSCTIITSAPGAQRVMGTISGQAQTIRMTGANNVMVNNVRIQARNPPRAGMYNELRCGVRTDDYWMGQNYWCSAFHVSNSWNIWLVKSSIYGRVDVFSSSNVYVDSNYIEGAYNLYSAVLVGNTGDAFKALMANVYVTNNKIYANNATCGVALQHFAVGVTVKNNDIRGFNQYGVSCGYGVTTNNDCMLSIISNNYIEYLDKFYYSGAQAGLYFNTHWTGPGNIAECNYIVKTSRCYMFDLGTSGTLILSGVCIGTSWAFSQNNGNYNMAVNQILLNSHSVGGMNMQNWLGLRCGLSAGNSWNKGLQRMARTPRLRALFPWISTDFCTKTSIKGIPCNQRIAGSPYRFYSAAETGNCSGIPHGNFFQFVSVNNLHPINSRYQWENAAPSMPLINRMAGVEAIRPSPTKFLSLAPWGFLNPARGDYGVKPNSPIKRKFPLFQSCPRALVGPRLVSYSTYWALFNTPKAPLKPYRLPHSNYPFPQ